MTEGWVIKRLDEISYFINGLWNGKKSPFKEVGVIRNTNFTKECDLNFSDIAYLKVEEKLYKTRKLEPGDIILEKSGGGPKQPVGRVVLFDKEEGEFSFSNFTSVIRINDRRRIDPKYLQKFLYYQYSTGYTEKMQSHSTGIRNLKFDEYKGMLIPLPPLPEQQHIVSILDEAFSAIAKAKENTEKNLQNVKELFDSYLHSVFANPKEDWEEKNIEEICLEIFAGGDAPKNFSKIKNEHHPIPIYANAVAYNGLYGYTNEARVRQSSITVSARGSGTGHTEIRYDNYLPIVRLIVLIPNLSRIDIKFLYYAISNLDILRSGSAIPQLTVPMLKAYNIKFPSLTEQEKIVNILDYLSINIKKIEVTYKNKISRFEELKRSVLQKAFTGELTLSEEVDSL